MKFRRKSAPEPEAADESTDTPVQDEGVPALPRDSSEVGEEAEMIDLGSLRIPPIAGRDVRLQVDEQSGTVQAVLIVGPDGALEVRAFAAPRHGALWEEARPQIAADTAQSGGTATERAGRFGTELMCSRPTQAPDGRAAVQPSRVVGVDGDRWMLRGTFVGRPAVEPDQSTEWDDAFAAIVVHRGNEAMPAGEALPVELPPQAHRAE